MTITIKEKEYQLKYSFRALMIYENITHKSFNPQTISDIVVFFYAIILASNKKCELLFDDFLDWIDENPNIITEFSEWLTNIFTQQQQISPVTPEQEKINETKEEQKNA